MLVKFLVSLPCRLDKPKQPGKEAKRRYRQTVGCFNYCWSQQLLQVKNNTCKSSIYRSIDRLRTQFHYIFIPLRCPWDLVDNKSPLIKPKHIHTAVASKKHGTIVCYISNFNTRPVLNWILLIVIMKTWDYYSASTVIQSM